MQTLTILYDVFSSKNHGEYRPNMIVAMASTYVHIDSKAWPIFEDIGGTIWRNRKLNSVITPPTIETPAHMIVVKPTIPWLLVKWSLPSRILFKIIMTNAAVIEHPAIACITQWAMVRCLVFNHKVGTLLSQKLRTASVIKTKNCIYIEERRSDEFIKENHIILLTPSNISGGCHENNTMPL